jgi:hypothetical protein
MFDFSSNSIVQQLNFDNNNLILKSFVFEIKPKSQSFEPLPKKVIEIIKNTQ